MNAQMMLAFAMGLRFGSEQASRQTKDSMLLGLYVAAKAAGEIDAMKRILAAGQVELARRTGR